MKKIKNWSIGSWLLTGFSIILLLVVVQGLISYRQTKELSLQTETMYNHPLTVRRAIDNLQLDVNMARLEFRNYILADTPQEKQAAADGMELALFDVSRQFEILDARYLGPMSDVEAIKETYYLWLSERNTNVDLIDAGEINQVLESIGATGSEGIKIDRFLEKVRVVDDYAQDKSDELYRNSLELHDIMITQLLIIVSSLFVFTLLIGLWLYRSFRGPLSEMSRTVLAFQSGNLDKRISFESSNELGNLAASINVMADSIQQNDMSQRITNEFSDVLISENIINRFFQTVLKSLMEYTNSVASAIHLYKEDTGRYDYFDSIGLDQKGVMSLDMKSKDGEFASVLIDKEPKVIKLKNTDSRIIYNTLITGLIPEEVMSIPLVSNDQVIAIITLAKLEPYQNNEIELVDQLVDNLTSRTEAILATERINEFIYELEQRSTELVAQNAELELQKKQLNEASKLKSNFLSNMSHELRTPLNSVIALSGVLYERLKGDIPSEEYSYLEIIGRNGKHLLSLINDILDISRIESGRVELDISDFNVNTIISEISSMFTVTAKEKGINIEHKEPNKKIFIQSDYDKCMHILQNLVSNAVKFTEKGSVSVETIVKKKHIEVIVSDTGIGISKENQDHIFEEFRQAESGTSRRFGGTGLGLSIAKKYANMLQGDITVSSKPNKGSKFVLILPVKFTGDVVVETNAMIEDTFSNNNNIDTSIVEQDTFDKVVLLIDDNESVVIQVKDLVKGMGIKLLTASNGEDGLHILETQHIDGIILDLMMPGIDGFDVLREVRHVEKTAHVPVLVLTAKHITKKDLNELNRNNIHQLVQKGDVDRIELQKTIFNMLYKRVVTTKKVTRDKPLKILMVEDNPDNRTTLKAVLKGYGEIIEAVDGEQGVLMAKEHMPDVILMDIALPKVSGIEAFHMIRKSVGLEQVPIIAITASALEEEKANILSHGFTDFIPKPVVPEVLFNSLEKALYDDK